MKRPSILGFIGILLAASNLAAQDLVINNVRIVVGKGQVIEQGTILIKGGRIVSAAPGNTPAPGIKAVDGKGLTAVAGYIDAHRHIYQGRNNADAWLKNDAPTRMREFLEAGYMTVVSGGGSAEPVVALKKAIDSGQFKGPPIIMFNHDNVPTFRDGGKWPDSHSCTKVIRVKSWVRANQWT